MWWSPSSVSAKRSWWTKNRKNKNWWEHLRCKKGYGGIKMWNKTVEKSNGNPEE